MKLEEPSKTLRIRMNSARNENPRTKILVTAENNLLKSLMLINLGHGKIRGLFYIGEGFLCHLIEIFR